MNAHDLGAEKDGDRDGGHRAMQPLVHRRAIQQMADEGLARGSDEHREIRELRRQSVQQRYQSDVLLQGLAESNARIEHDGGTRDTASFGFSDAPSPPGAYFREDVSNRRLRV